MKENRTFVDIEGMPDYNPIVKDNIKSVSECKVEIEELEFGKYPACIKHGAMNKVSKDGIWRCLMCGVGCYEVRGELKTGGKMDEEIKIQQVFEEFKSEIEKAFKIVENMEMLHVTLNISLDSWGNYVNYLDLEFEIKHPSNNDFIESKELIKLIDSLREEFGEDVTFSLASDKLTVRLSKLKKLKQG